MNRERVNTFKLGVRKVAVDGACVIILLAASYGIIGGLTTLYTSYYNTLKIPPPEVFSASSTQFAGSISLGYLLLLTRKYRVPKNGEESQKKSGE